MKYIYYVLCTIEGKNCDYFPDRQTALKDINWLLYVSQAKRAELA